MACAEAHLHTKFHLDPCNRLATIHQCYRQTDRQDIQRSDSIGRTVLQTVAQKQLKYHKENEDGLILGQAGPPSLTAAYTCSLHKLLLHQVSHLVSQLFLNFLKCSVLTSAQEQLKWATVPEQSGPKSGGLAVPLSVGELQVPM